MTLDEQLRALCEEHDLANISISMSRHEFESDDRCFQQVAVQWFDSNAEHGRGIATSEHRVSIREGIAQAIERMNAKRSKPAVISDLEAA